MKLLSTTTGSLLMKMPKFDISRKTVRSHGCQSDNVASKI
jgi:hypothetical protein